MLERYQEIGILPNHVVLISDALNFIKICEGARRANHCLEPQWHWVYGTRTISAQSQALFEWWCNRCWSCFHGWRHQYLHPRNWFQLRPGGKFDQTWVSYFEKEVLWSTIDRRWHFRFSTSTRNNLLQIPIANDSFPRYPNGNVQHDHFLPILHLSC